MQFKITYCRKGVLSLVPFTEKVIAPTVSLAKEMFMAKHYSEQVTIQKIEFI